MRVALVPRLERKHKDELKKHPTQTNEDLGGWVNDLLTDVLDKDEFLRIYAPAISYLSVYENVLHLKDSRVKNNEIHIYLKDKELWCEYDENTYCEHIRY